MLNSECSHNSFIFRRQNPEGSAYNGCEISEHNGKGPWAPSGQPF